MKNEIDGSSGNVSELINCQKSSEKFVKNSLLYTKDEQKQIDLEEKHQNEDLEQIPARKPMYKVADPDLSSPHHGEEVLESVDVQLSFQSIFSISITKVEEGAGEDRSEKRDKVDEQKNELYSGE